MTGTAASAVTLPKGVTVFERGWLSSNNILIQGPDHCALIDSGYCTHAPQTVALVHAALHTRPLDWLLNTPLHSDHCGAKVAATWPRSPTRCCSRAANCIWAKGSGRCTPHRGTIRMRLFCLNRSAAQSLPPMLYGRAVLVWCFPSWMGWTRLTPWLPRWI